MKYLILAVVIVSLCSGQVLHTQSSREMPLARNVIGMHPANERVLAPLTNAELTPRTHHGLKAIGVGRKLATDIMSTGAWTTGPNGQSVWRLAIRSTGAWGLRIHFQDFETRNGKVWVYPSSSTEPAEFAGPFTDSGLFHDGEFWSEPVRGESVVIEYAPASGSAGPVPFNVDQVSHLFRMPLRSEPPPSLRVTRPVSGRVLSVSPDAGTTGSQDTCSPDVACYPQWLPQAAAVATISFVDSGASYMCTASLVNDTAQDQKPYFLTANHCVSDDTVARTVVAYFQYQAASCGGPAPSYFSVPTVSGAHYLSSAPIPQGDFSLMMLASAPPPGSAFLSWDGGQPNVGDAVTGIHHPGTVIGGYAPNSKRISFGTVSAPSDTDVEGEVMPAALSISVDWTPGDGYTEPGSSGSPLLSSSGKLLGTLTGGAEGPMWSACTPSYAIAVYGKFATALQTLSAFLGTAAQSQPSCTITAAGPSQPIAYSGGQAILAVSDSGTCAWTASSNASWLHLSASSGSSSSNVSMTADPNSATTQRSANITVGSSVVTVTQSAAPQTATAAGCEYRIAPPSVAEPSFGGSAYASATATSGCTITPAPTQAWLSPFATATSATTASLYYVASANQSALPRVGAIQVGGVALQVVQDGTNAPLYFTDVPATDSRFNHITLLKYYGLTDGCSATTYCPETTVSREQMAKFLVTAVVGKTGFSYSPTPYFDDVPATSQYFPYIQKLKELGITVGCSTAPALYCPSQAVTRTQMARFLIRAKIGATFSYSPTPYFTDVPSSSDGFSYIQKMRDLGITVGCSDTAYCGDQNTTRAQMAVFLVRTFYSGVVF